MHRPDLLARAGEIIDPDRAGDRSPRPLLYLLAVEETRLDPRRPIDRAVLAFLIGSTSFAAGVLAHMLWTGL